jgi:hypothetical protein
VLSEMTGWNPTIYKFNFVDSSVIKAETTLEHMFLECNSTNFFKKNAGCNIESSQWQKCRCSADFNLTIPFDRGFCILLV